MQAAGHNAEVQVSSLEAALAKGSEVTVSMTEKVAQAMSAANAQMESLKVDCGWFPDSQPQASTTYRGTCARLRTITPVRHADYC